MANKSPLKTKADTKFSCFERWWYLESRH